jgi:hypothetical protein
VGALYAIAPALQNTGKLESEVLDANEFAYWGKAHLSSTLHGGAITLETRSGNLNNPENNWSSWAKVAVTELGGAIESPPARFLQYRVTLTRSPGGESPELSTVDIAYLPKNIAPIVHQIEIAPFNYRQAASTAPVEKNVTASGSPATLSLPAVGQKRTTTPSVSLEGATATLQYSKGYVTIRWSASDPNNDPLIYKVEIRGKKDSFWRTLKDKVQDRFYSFDSTAFPDGEYVARVTASDAPGNTPADTLTCSLDSEPFIINNTPPEIINVKIASNGGRREISFTAKDALNWIDKAEYSIDGGDWTLLDPVNKVTDSQTLDYRVEAGANQMVAVRVFDEYDNVVVKQFPFQR